MQIVQGSAKIYQFPTGGRANESADRLKADAATIRRDAERPVVDIHGWYHQDAIQDAQAPVKH